MTRNWILGALAAATLSAGAAQAQDKVTFLTSWFAQAEHGGDGAVDRLVADEAGDVVAEPRLDQLEQQGSNQPAHEAVGPAHRG